MADGRSKLSYTCKGYMCCHLLLTTVQTNRTCQVRCSDSACAQVNATGVMPVIFASTLMSLPTALGRNIEWLQPLAVQLSPTKPLFLPVCSRVCCGQSCATSRPHWLTGLACDVFTG